MTINEYRQVIDDLKTRHRQVLDNLSKQELIEEIIQLFEEGTQDKPWIHMTMEELVKERKTMSTDTCEFEEDDCESTERKIKDEN